MNHPFIIDEYYCCKNVNLLFVDWVVNGTRLEREFINEDEQIRLLKSILAHKSIKASLEFSYNTEINLRCNKNQQIHILKSMLIKKSYGLPKIYTDFMELPVDIQVCQTC